MNNLIKKGETIIEKDKITIYLNKEDFIEWRFFENIYGVGFTVFTRILNQMGIYIKMKEE
jgi:hypothetical protein